MGAFQTLWFGLGHLEIFSGFGVFSGGVVSADDEKLIAAFATARNRPRLNVFWVGVGGLDRNRTFARRLDAALTKANIAHKYIESERDGHTWPFWRRSLADFLPLLFTKGR